MKCTYCTNLARVQLAGREVWCCDTCRALYNAKDWEALARRWLEYKPQDWQRDVEAYLEGTAPDDPRFELVQRRPSSHLPGDLADPDPSDWL